MPELPFAPAGATGLPLQGVTPADLTACLAGLPMPQSRFVAMSGFRAEPGEIVLLPADAADPFPYGALAAGLPAGVWRLAAGFAQPEAAVLGFALGAYRFERLKSVPTFRPAPSLALREAGCETALSAARATFRVRDLINLPANLLGPAELAAEAAAALHAAAPDMRIETLAGEALEAGYPAVAAVGRGAERPPAVLVAEWTGPGAAAGPLIAICGKGVCFDTGGLDLKPAAAMLRMKKDMAGAATALGLACMIAEARLPVRFVLRLGCAENSVSSRAMRPLDVIRTRKGLRVEIGNTDAEGRRFWPICWRLRASRHRRW